MNYHNPIRVWLSRISLIFFACVSVCVAAESEQSTTIPKTLPEIWKAIDEHSAALQNVIHEKKFQEVHAHAFAIRDLVNALPAKSAQLIKVQLKTLQQNSGYINQLATRLDKSGDANDEEATKANYEKLKTLLQQIRALYPTSLK